MVLLEFIVFDVALFSFILNTFMVFMILFNPTIFCKT
jgi:hypothetical protein